jgi:competence protein ComEA
MEKGAANSRGLIVLCSVLSFIVGGALGYFTPRPQEPSAPITISTPIPTSTMPPTATPAPIRVYISGAVQSPAVYELPQSGIVQDAIDAAGGPAPGADLTRINLAQQLQDQQHVHVPREGEANPPPVVSGGAEGSAGSRVNINTAAAEELETLPGIGAVTAQRIIEYRQANGPFETIDAIQNVSGIGPKTFEGMRDTITVGP